MAGEVDLKLVPVLVNGETRFDLDFAPDGEPRLLKGAAVVGQDLGNRIRASGLVENLIASDADGGAGPVAEIVLAVEADTRIQVGSVTAAVSDGRVQIGARTIEGTTVSAEV